MFLVLVVGGSLGLGALLFSAMDVEVTRRRDLFGAWHAAVRAAGLTSRQLTEHESDAQGSLEGLSIGAHLKLELSNKQHVYNAKIWAKSADIPRKLSVHRDSSLRAFARWGERGDVPIGDPGFDEQVELPELDAHVCAALDHTARVQLGRLLDWGGYIENGYVVCASSWTPHYNASLPALVRSVAALARRLAVPPEQLTQRLASNALRDPAAEVRVHNLRYLVAPETNAAPALIASTVSALLAHPYPPLRLLAAQHAGVHGRMTLRALAHDDAVALDVRVEAARSLGGAPGVQDPEGLCSVLVDGTPPEVLYAALCAVGASNDRALLDAVQGRAKHEHDSVRAAAARALGVLAAADTEPLLIALLSDASADVQQCSAEALGLFGSVAAVEPLLPLAASLVRPRLRQAARGAIGRIQSRLGDVEAGRLTLSDPDHLAGALDVADAATGPRLGELSLTPEAATEHELSAPPQRKLR
ncbi:MAG TPA: HEAT repeat domain-containing protein [Polyangiaceae bacterium]|nr:HEAT repeat domain-containing protein [Polyangiaceae bacterium]